MDRDKAIIEEAVRRAHQAASTAEGWDGDTWDRHLASTTMELVRSGWQPAVDPDVLAVREIVVAYNVMKGTTAEMVLEGGVDSLPYFRAALAAYKKHKGGSNAAD